MRVRVAFTLLLLLLATSAFATTVRGKVVGPDGATPYPDVEVTVEATKEVLYTDADGEFFVANLNPGEYTVTVKTSRSTTRHKITALDKPVTEVRISVR